VFATLTWRELEKIERIVHRRRFGAGEVVLRAWVPRSGFFVVVSGSVNVVRRADDGSDIVVGELGEGELLGEFALLDDTPRSTSIVAAEKSELVGFFRPDLMDLVATDPRLGFKVLYRLSQAIAGQFRSDIERLRRVRRELEAVGLGG
ncbi:MAG: cyclic nucleotide-binding domain-containing protein, partial [Candidatus Latescibacteria bacterium]|nr:cyclic nucleotide-binding domain-containing protein [Candidatus Latescibacterota bacterium]